MAVQAALSTTLSLFVLSEVLAAEPAVNYALQPAGKLTIRSERQKLGSQCEAERSWPEISNLPSSDVQEKLNKKFRQILSVGRKLKASDCPAPGDPETFKYINRAYVGGRPAGYVSIEFSMIFPGGRGRIAKDCRIFNLKDGSEIQLVKFLKKDSFTSAQKIMGQTLTDIRAEYEPEGFKGESPYSPLCLQSDGLYLLRNAHEESRNDRVKLGKAERAALFKELTLVEQLVGEPVK